MTLRRATLALLLALSSCAGFPRDPDGTAERVRAEKGFRVGLIDGGGEARVPVRAFLARVESLAGGRAAVERGPAEPLLTKLRDGDLDLVVGIMSPTSPWEAEVHFLPALRERVAPRLYERLVPMARHGENRWIALLDRAARDGTDGG